MAPPGTSPLARQPWAGTPASLKSSPTRAHRATLPTSRQHPSSLRREHPEPPSEQSPRLQSSSVQSSRCCGDREELPALLAGGEVLHDDPGAQQPHVLAIDGHGVLRHRQPAPVRTEDEHLARRGGSPAQGLARGRTTSRRSGSASRQCPGRHTGRPSPRAPVRRWCAARAGETRECSGADASCHRRMNSLASRGCKLAEFGILIWSRPIMNANATSVSQIAGPGSHSSPRSPAERRRRNGCMGSRTT